MDECKPLLDGPLMARYRGLAQQHHIWLSLGGFAEAGPDPAHRYNTHVLLDDQAGHGIPYFRGSGHNLGR
jgi:hypothetical protein